jgi:hypothetical protein
VLIGLATLAAGFCLFIAIAGRALADQPSAFCIATGILIAVLSLWRPWWYWDEPRVTFLRWLIGDRGSIAVYLALAAGVVLFGITRARRVASARAECLALVATAPTPHARALVMDRVPSVAIPPLGAGSEEYTCRSLLHGAAAR